MLFNCRHEMGVRVFVYRIYCKLIIILNTNLNIFDAACVS